MPCVSGHSYCESCDRRFRYKLEKGATGKPKLCWRRECQRLGPRLESRKKLDPQLRDTVHLTPTEERIMALLADGKPHSINEIHECLFDTMSPVQAVWTRITLLRKKLNPIGREIVCEVVGGLHKNVDKKAGGTSYYRHVMLIPLPEPVPST